MVMLDRRLRHHRLSRVSGSGASSNLLIASAPGIKLTSLGTGYSDSVGETGTRRARTRLRKALLCRPLTWAYMLSHRPFGHLSGTAGGGT